MSQLVKTGSTTEISLFDPNYLAALEALSKRFAHSEMVPDFYKAGAVLKKNQPPQTAEKAEANCFIAINMAMRLGADPLMVMQNMKPIMGSPSLSAKFIIALINSSGVYDDLEFDFVDQGKISKIPYVEWEWNNQAGRNVAKNMVFEGPIDNLTCVCKSRKKGSTKDLVGPEVSVKMAIEELWYTKSGSKWPNMTRLMLMYRSATLWASTHAPHITMGIPSTEEMEDIRAVEEGSATVVSSKIKEAARKSVSVDPTPSPTKEPTQVVEPEPEKVVAEVDPVASMEEEALEEADGTGVPGYMRDDLDEDDDDIARISHE